MANNIHRINPGFTYQEILNAGLEIEFSNTSEDSLEMVIHVINPTSNQKSFNLSAKYDTKNNTLELGEISRRDFLQGVMLTMGLPLTLTLNNINNVLNQADAEEETEVHSETDIEREQKINLVYAGYMLGKGEISSIKLPGREDQEPFDLSYIPFSDNPDPPLSGLTLILIPTQLNFLEKGLA